MKTIRSYYNGLPVSFKKIIIASLLISLFFILKAYTNHLINEYNYPFSWLLTVLKISTTYILWVILTPLAYSLTKIIQNIGPFKVSKILNFTVGCIFLAIFHQIIASRLDDIFNYINSGYLKSDRKSVV